MFKKDPTENHPRHAKREILNKISRFFRTIYLKLFRVNDSPQRVAWGFGLGVFFGVLPGLGPIAALFLAFVFKVNRAAALLGSILTNTWLSIPVFFLAIEAGAWATGSSYEAVRQQWSTFLHNFSWTQLLHISADTIAVPIITGYLLVSLCIGLIAYAVAFMVLKLMKRARG